ncbi:hypothetical protein HWV03_12430 [Moritella sp. 36]|uniref:hypothetical protein n=1 Tax=Moritella sp. 36 TaxID=2746233 RepID=UPI001BA7679F|nr:hypothetical protein [Moritella sp. 36]QUM89549.1 hypothetical protein HWV03_12430 [Moritella sp. 36]
MSAKSTAPVAPKIVLSHDTSLLELSSKDIRSYSYNSGLVTKPGTDGFSVVHGNDYIEIKYPIRLIQARNTDSVQVIIGNADLEVKLPKSIKKKQPFNSSFMNKRVNTPFIPPGYDVRGAVAQTIVDQMNAKTKVYVTGFVALTLGKGPVSGTVTIFGDFKDGISINGTLNADNGSDSAKPSGKSFDVALGLAYHSGKRDVFENLGLSFEAANMGVAFTVDSKTGNITADGMQIYVHSDSMASVSASYEKNIYDTLFGEDNIWSEIQLLLDNRITGMSADEFIIEDGMAILESVDDMDNVKSCDSEYSADGGWQGAHQIFRLGKSGRVYWYANMYYVPDHVEMTSVKTGRVIVYTGFMRGERRGTFPWDYKRDGGNLLVNVVANPTHNTTKWHLYIGCPQ